MEFIVLAVVVAAILVSGLVVRPSLRAVRIGRARFWRDDGHLVISPGGGAKDLRLPVGEVYYAVERDHRIVDVHRAATSHSATVGTIGPGGIFSGQTTTVHSPGGSWQEKGGAYYRFSFKRFGQVQTNERLLASNSVVCHATGVAPLDPRQYLFDFSLDMGWTDKFVLKRWLHGHGIYGVPDERSAEQNFRTTTEQLLSAYRASTGWQEGDLECLSVDEQLAPVSYARLSSSDELIVHHVASNASDRVGAQQANVHGYRCHRQTSEHVLVLLSAQPPRAVRVIISKPMTARLLPHLKARGKSVDYQECESIPAV